eukprot:scaffold1954_cov33-Attheya_sp.AAC.6
MRKGGPSSSPQQRPSLPGWKIFGLWVAFWIFWWDVASIDDDERLQQQEQPSEQEFDKEPLSQLQQQQQCLADRDYFGALGTMALTLSLHIKELHHGDDVEQQRQLGGNSIRMHSESVLRTIAGVTSSQTRNNNNTAS